MEPLEFPLEFFKTLRAEWATVSTHLEAFVTTLIFGLVFGWIAAWLILKQRLDHHKELVEYYKDVVSDKIPGNPSVRLSQLNRQWRLSLPLLGRCLFSSALFLPLTSQTLCAGCQLSCLH